MNSIYVLGHLGAGDHLLTNGLIRKLAERYDLVQVPCYLHNYESVSFMYRDNPKIQPVAIKDDADAIAVSKENKVHSLNLGYYNPYGFNADIFDQEFYRQASIHFEERWNSFYVKCPVSDGGWDHPDFAFVHDDKERGFVIDESKIKLDIIKPVKNGHIFNNMMLIRAAEEIHCINSSFLILVDSLPDIPGQELFFHKYARPTSHPKLKRKWNIL